MTKTRTNISINKELLKKAREYDINISAFVEYNLRLYFAQIEGKTIYTQNVQSYTPNTNQLIPKKQQKTSDKNANSYRLTPTLGFENQFTAIKI